jgi:alpha/beta superfamily hydrolase
MERFFIRGRAGRLEALLEEPPVESRAAALLCHPLPPGGGTMHTHAVFRAMRALRSRGIAVLRFNFRGVGQSEGRWDEGPGEMEDGLTAFEVLRERFPQLPLISGGFSFGSWVGMNAGVQLGAQALLGLGIPFRSYDYSAVGQSELPKGLVHADKDEFTPLDVLESGIAAWRPPVRLWTLEGASHLFTEKLDAYETLVGDAVGWLMAELARGGPSDPSG